MCNNDIVRLRTNKGYVPFRDILKYLRQEISKFNLPILFCIHILYILNNWNNLFNQNSKVLFNNIINHYSINV